MIERKIKNDVPDVISKEKMIEKINQTLNDLDYSVVYLIYIFLDCIENDKK